MFKTSSNYLTRYNFIGKLLFLFAAFLAIAFVVEITGGIFDFQSKLASIKNDPSDYLFGIGLLVLIVGALRLSGRVNAFRQRALRQPEIWGAFKSKISALVHPADEAVKGLAAVSKLRPKVVKLRPILFGAIGSLAIGIFILDLSLLLVSSGIVEAERFLAPNERSRVSVSFSPGQLAIGEYRKGAVPRGLGLVANGNLRTADWLSTRDIYKTDVSLVQIPSEDLSSILAEEEAAGNLFPGIFELYDKLLFSDGASLQVLTPIGERGRFLANFRERLILNQSYIRWNCSAYVDKNTCKSDELYYLSFEGLSEREVRKLFLNSSGYALGAPRVLLDGERVRWPAETNLPRKSYSPGPPFFYRFGDEGSFDPFTEIDGASGLKVVPIGSFLLDAGSFIFSEYDDSTKRISALASSVQKGPFFEILSMYYTTGLVIMTRLSDDADTDLTEWLTLPLLGGVAVSSIFLWLFLRSSFLSIVQNQAFGNNGYGEKLSGVLVAPATADDEVDWLPIAVQEDMNRNVYQDSAKALDKVRDILAAQTIGGASVAAIDSLDDFENSELVHIAYFQSEAFAFYFASVLIDDFGLRPSDHYLSISEGAFPVGRIG